MSRIAMLRITILALASLIVGCSKEGPVAAGGPQKEPSTPNLLANADWEQDSTVGWTVPAPNRGNDVPGWADPETTGEQFRGGAKSLQLGPIESKEGESSQVVQQTVAVKGGKVWIDGWVRFEGKKRGATGKVRAGIQYAFQAGDEAVGTLFVWTGPVGAEFPADEGIVSLSLAQAEKTSWQQLPYHTMEELAAKGLNLSKPPDQVTVLLWLQVEGPATGQAWFDDIVVKEAK